MVILGKAFDFYGKLRRGRRRHPQDPRLRLELPATVVALRGPGERHSVVIENGASGGAKLVSPSRFRVGELLAVTVPVAEGCEHRCVVEVVWTIGCQLGVQVVDGKEAWHAVLAARVGKLVG